MILRSISLHNFGVFAGKQVVRPAVGQRGNRNITLVGGLNGRGKTSLLEAVLLALYGNRTPALREYGKSYSAYLASLVHRNADRQSETYIELELAIPVGTGSVDIRLRRTWSANKTRWTDRLEIWRAGELDTHLAANWASHIEEILPSALAGLFFFDGEKISALAEADETGDSLKHSIRSLLGLDLVDRLIADMGTVIRRNEAKLRDATARHELGLLHSKREELEQRRTYTLQKLAELKTRLDQAEAKRQEREQAFYESGGLLAEQRASLRAKELELTARFQEHKSAAAALAAGAAPLLLVLPMLEQIREQSHREQLILQAKSALQIFQERDQRLLSHLAQSGMVTEEVARLVKGWLEQDRSAYSELANQDVIFLLSDASRAQLERLLESSESIRQSAAAIIAEAQRTSSELEQVREYLDIHVDEERLRSILSDLATLTRSIERLKHERDSLEVEYASIQRELDQVQRKISQHASALADVEDAERIILYAGRTQETMRMFRERATRQKVGLLTREIFLAFEALTQKATLVSEIRMDAESLRISLHDVGGREIPKDRLSSGEKQMLAIAILWGLARSSGRILPVIIDTPMGRLDSSHRMNFVTKYLPNASHQVLVFSTDTEIVGPYLDSLNGSIGKTYLLRYHDTEQRTEIVEDCYFEPEGGGIQ